VASPGEGLFQSGLAEPSNAGLQFAFEESEKMVSFLSARRCKSSRDRFEISRNRRGSSFAIAIKRRALPLILIRTILSEEASTERTIFFPKKKSKQLEGITIDAIDAYTSRNDRFSFFFTFFSHGSEG